MVRNETNLRICVCVLLFSRKLQAPGGPLFDKNEARFCTLMAAAREGGRLSTDEIEVLEADKELLIQQRLVLPSIIELATVEQLVGWGHTQYVALLLKIAFPSKLFD